MCGFFKGSVFLNSTEVKLEYELCDTSKEGIPVIIVAAGASTRMKGLNKQLLELNGVPVIIQSLLRFENSSVIKNIILVIRTEDLFELQMLTEKYMITKLSDIVCGGATRQESVLKGLERLQKSDSKVLIHDGARPFVSDTVITNVTEALDKYSAVTCAVRVKDTIKRVDENGLVKNTLDRNTLVAVQTPQGVWVDKYLEAIKKAENVAAFTDDSSIMEAAGYEVACVEGSYKNIKITTPEDIAFVRALGEDEL